ncbi:Antibacterial factor-related peptide 2 [Orchesella cincta]|uniref:Antibacterial factor-related peptide 2 n=1 Tax=Orchesella cincta TaxID=48709 RepID=A0A1D2NHX9_ORCCI|nr:Antibacterial factor-related peptide 2 [Orchesella cincta]
MISKLAVFSCLMALYFVVILHENRVGALCCDNGNWAWVKKACCVASCAGQNCGTGDCGGPSGRTCYCRRCSKVPSSVAVSGRTEN